MKTLALALLLACSFNLFAQDIPKAELVDEFGLTNCDEFLARLDYFSIRIFQTPDARGVAVVSGSNEHLLDKLKLEVLAKYGIRRPGQDMTSKISLIRGKENGKALMQFWAIPFGADDTTLSASSWDFTIPKNIKPSYFFSDRDAVCSYGGIYGSLRELLTANPSLRVNAVVEAGNTREFRRKDSEIRSWLGKENTRRVRTFRKERLPSLEPSTEFWLLP